MTISRGFQGRRRPTVDESRVPTGQYVTDDFPVLSAAPTPRTRLAEWTFEIPTVRPCPSPEGPEPVDVPVAPNEVTGWRAAAGPFLRL
jgi:hypothetical protein